MQIVFNGDFAYNKNLLAKPYSCILVYKQQVIL